MPTSDVEAAFASQVRVPVPPRKVRIMPTMAAANPETIIQIDRLVGAPVKVWETLEVKDCEAWMPKIRTTIPATNSANPIAHSFGTFQYYFNVRRITGKAMGCLPGPKFQCPRNIQGSKPNLRVIRVLRSNLQAAFQPFKKILEITGPFAFCILRSQDIETESGPSGACF